MFSIGQQFRAGRTMNSTPAAIPVRCTQPLMVDYKKYILENKVPLLLLDKIFFFLKPLLSLIPGLFLLYSICFSNNQNQKDTSLGLTFSIALILFGSYLIYLTRQKFKFTYLESHLPYSEKERIITQISRDFKWSLDRKSSNYYRFHDSGSLFKSSNYVSILFDEKGYYVNVFDAKWRPLDFGSLRRKSQKIIDLIEGSVQQVCL
ncbi:hypothetical protein [Hymenobacter elongatus]|uniref:YcxB family protein n=1 Tax=Hymenobacter elongatus TaxID=877208 RepID=A0A4Z0PPU2_9BACT|nr:hypothetical protein [Hymenobacter elongatus]TGE18920.1 hypothetical protein E5J99_04035 [Hymenobacter elongatus]